MDRHWYHSSPTVDGLPLLADPAFWPAHLADLYEGLSPEEFGVDPGDADALLGRLEDKSAWPVFHVPLAGGHQIVVHYNNGEEHTTVDFFLTHPDWAGDPVLASADEDRIRPGPCWPELAAILHAPDGAIGVTERHARLLLLLPALGDLDITDEALAAAVGALRHYGARRTARLRPGSSWAATRCGEPLPGTSTRLNTAGSAAATTAGTGSPRRLPADQRAAGERCLAPGEWFPPSPGPVPRRRDPPWRHVGTGTGWTF